MSILALTFAAALLQPPALPQDQTGSYLFHSCQLALRVTDDDHVRLSPTDLADASICGGYLTGYFEAGRCGRTGSVPTLIRVYVRYMEQNPALLDEGRWLGVDQAINNTYHCHK